MVNRKTTNKIISPTAKKVTSKTVEKKVAAQNYPDNIVQQALVQLLNPGMYHAGILQVIVEELKKMPQDIVLAQTFNFQNLKPATLPVQAPWRDDNFRDFFADYSRAHQLEKSNGTTYALSIYNLCDIVKNFNNSIAHKAASTILEAAPDNYSDIIIQNKKHNLSVKIKIEDYLAKNFHCTYWSEVEQIKVNLLLTPVTELLSDKKFMRAWDKLTLSHTNEIKNILKSEDFFRDARLMDKVVADIKILESLSKHIEGHSRSYNYHTSYFYPAQEDKIKMLVKSFNSQLDDKQKIKNLSPLTHLFASQNFFIELGIDEFLKQNNINKFYLNSDALSSDDLKRYALKCFEYSDVPKEALRPFIKFIDENTTSDIQNVLKDIELLISQKSFKPLVEKVLEKGCSFDKKFKLTEKQKIINEKNKLNSTISATDKKNKFKL